MEAQSFVNDLMNKDEMLSALIEKLRIDIEKITKSLPRLRGGRPEVPLDLRAAENNLRVLRGREVQAIKSLHALRAEEEDNNQPKLDLKVPHTISEPIKVHLLW